jgi:7-cyano-7-deazaguanine synthase
MRAIALLSGGLDSVVAAWAARREWELVLALTFDYGQRARECEIQAARAVARRLGCAHVVLPLPWLGALGKSALTDPSAHVPALASEQLDDPGQSTETAAAVWVPNRNGVFLNVAAAYADAMDCRVIVVGFNVEEAATFPDNSAEFMDVAGRFFALSTQAHPRVVSPTVGLDKARIVTLAREIGAPIGLVWSCYHGGEEHCWQCESCNRLRRALQRAGAWEAWQAGELA